MKRSNWQIISGVFLVALPALFYFIHFSIFKDVYHIFIYLLGDVAFVSIEVLLAILIIHQLLKKEKRALCWKDLRKLPDTNFKRLAKNIEKAYNRLVYQWLDYMKHLKENYPYLFSLTMRTNPFDRNASPIVK